MYVQVIIIYTGCFQPLFFDGMADLLTLTQQALSGTDIELVDIERAPLGVLRVTIDHPQGVLIEHCEQVSRQLTHLFEVENVDYGRLEVGSPGVDRPLRSLADFARFMGERIEVKLKQPIENQKVFVGLLGLATEGTVNSEGVQTFTVEFEAKKNDVRLVAFSFNDVDRAKLSPVLDFKGKKR
jgi:ribosome maturation factor RimP